MKIFNKIGVEILDVNVSDESYRLRQIMSSPTLTLYFNMDSFTEIPTGAYADFQGERFYLFDATNFRKNSSEDFEYTLILHGIAETLNRFRFYDFVNGGLIFPLTATPDDHIAMLVNVLNAKDSGWTAGTIVDTKEISINYNHVSCMAALGMMCDEAETEFEITPAKVINFRKTEYNKEIPLELAYGKGNGLKPGVERKNDDNERPIERLYVQGGTRNIDYSTYGSRYLLLPDSQQLTYNTRVYQVSADGLYIQRADKALTTLQESSLDASTIYPSRVNIVSDVEIIDLQNNLYNVIDATIPEALNFEENVIAGQNMSIVFQTGILAGKEFEVKYIHEFKRFEIVPKEIDGYDMPSGVFIPAEGDLFVVFGCSFPDAYVRDDDTETGASWDMFREGVAYLYEHEEENYSYGGSISPIWLKANWATVASKLVLGGYCSLTDPELGDVLIRIRSIKDYINNPFDVEIDMSNALVKPSINTTLAKIDSYTSQFEQLIKNYYETLFQGGSIEEILRILQNSGFVDTRTTLIYGNPIWLSGMNYETTDFLYLILGTKYFCPAVELITLEAADPTYPRIDVFYLDTYSNLNIKTGTPSVNPVEPTLTELECYVTSVYIGAGATEPSYISRELIYDEKTAGEWTPTAYAEAGKTTVDLEAIEEPYSGDKHIDIEIAVPDEELSLPEHFIGEEYQGGIIFWINPTDKRKGLIAAKTDTATDVFWSRLGGFSEHTTGATGTAIGTGQSNTNLMLALDASKDQAAKYADQLVIGEYDDWFIGSMEEMRMLWNRRYEVGNFNPTKDYWTSTEHSWNYAARVDWETGDIRAREKNTYRNVRAIRKFDDSSIPSTDPVEAFTPQDTAIVFQAPDTVLAAEGILSFRMKSNMPWRENSILRIETYNGVKRTGSCALSKATSLFGFNDQNDESYSLVAIFHSNFSLSETAFDGLKFSLIGSWPNDINLFIDKIQFQHTTALQERPQGTTLQIQGQVLYQANWVSYTYLYKYTYENPNIKATSTVDIIPDNDDLDIVLAAVINPEVEVEAGKITIQATNLPDDDIRVTINVQEASL